MQNSGGERKKKKKKNPKNVKNFLPFWFSNYLILQYCCHFEHECKTLQPKW